MQMAKLRFVALKSLIQPVLVDFNMKEKLNDFEKFNFKAQILPGIK